MKFHKKGQNTAEYAILIALVVAAAVAMQTYVKRSWQGGVKFAVDKVKKSDGVTGQYEPYYLESDYAVDRLAYKDTVETEADGKVIRDFGVEGDGLTAHEVQRSGSQTIKATDGAN